MRTHYKHILFFFFLSMIRLIGYSQTGYFEESDSGKLYKKIQKFSDERIFTKFLFKLVFKPIVPEGKEEPAKTEIKKQFYTAFEGKVIRDIHITTLDPFGFNVHDTSAHPRSFFEKSGNNLHLKTFPLTIKNRLIIKKSDTFDSLRVRESERLVRNQVYVREVVFTPVLVGSSDSVDIYIRVVDVWSIIATGSASMSKFRINIKDKNFLGMGQQVQNDYSLDHTNGDFTNSTDYNISNVFNTFINTTLHYDTDNKKNYNESCNIDRPFYSVFTKWAGGVYLLQHLKKGVLYSLDSVPYVQNYKINTQDYWVGKSWQLFRGKTENVRTTNFIISGRYLKVHYLDKPPVYIDTTNIYSNEDFYMIGMGLQKRKYKQDSYIFKYGFIEDVPVGRAFSIIAGYQIKNNINRLYIGTRVYWANYYAWGYFSSNLEYGTFIKSSKTEESCLTFGTNYFSPIFKFGRWKFRQFIKPQFTIGFNRSKNENLSLSNEPGIRGFNGSGLSGDQKIVFSLQTQSYAPWDFFGFRFGPYFVCSYGVLGSESAGFGHSHIYSQYGVGLLIKNDYLVQGSFEISVAYFPFIPGTGNNVFKPNPFRTTDFGFRESDVGKPSTVTYR